MKNFFKSLFKYSYSETDKDKIISLMKSINNIDNLNRGGCLFAAYAVYLKAKKLGIKGISLAQIDFYGNNDITTNKSFLKGDIEKPTSGNHFALKINGDIIDSKGIRDFSNDRIFIIRKQKDIDKLAVASLKITSGWNPEFNRGEGVYKIHKILGIDLSYCL